MLQNALADSWDMQPHAPSQRWAPRATLLFSGGVSLWLWAAIIGGGLEVLRLLDM